MKIARSFFGDNKPFSSFDLEILLTDNNQASGVELWEEMCSIEEERTGQRELHKLQVMLRDIEQSNDLQSPEKCKHINEPVGEFEDSKDSNSDEKQTHKFSLEKNHSHLEESLLEYESDFEDWEEDITLDDEDSWLLKTPPKNAKSGDKPKCWLTDDIRTPELNRVKGSLASKLDLISIQNRKDKLNNLLAKHNIGQHSESAPGRLYQAESMCSVMSLDWEYDQDSPIRRRDFGKSMENNALDDLQPMSLKFESSPVSQRSVQIAPGPLTRRVGSSGMNANFRSSSFSDRSDSSGDFSTSPRSSLGSSRNSLELADDIAVRKPKAKGGRKILLPISSLFEASIPEETLENKRVKSGIMLNPYAAWDLMTEQKLASGRCSSETSSFPPQGDANLTVKLPTASSDGPAIRRRAPGNQLSQSSDSIPRSRRSNIGSPYSSKDQVSASTSVRSSMPRPRTSIPSSKKNVVSPRVSQNPDVVPRRGRSPERRSRSPDIVPRKSGIVPRGQLANRY
ncbi:uncharacterized protein LOC135686092 isoform X2 [Rhopilema esculentum]|uniref:uncharacterized protein LOC135686092 isoform X2 n=1 Tax=Rhopilema esculentum TaxID=499914 RepID=UPI0031DF48A1